MSKTFIVTGASSGIGRTIAENMLTDGHAVVGLARDFEKCPIENNRFHQFELDLGDLENLPEQLKSILKAYPDIDGVIFNAGRGEFGKLEQFSYDQIRSLMDLNFLSHAYLARAVAPRMKRAGGGDLIFIGSEAALAGHQMGAVYCASKFALRGFAQALREECASAGVRVTIVNPGMVLTPFFDKTDFSPGEDEANFTTPEDVAAAVAMVLSTRPGTDFDEINLSPLKRVVRRRPKKKK